MHPQKLQSLLQQALTHHQAGRLQNAAVLYAQLRALAPRSFEGFHLGGATALQLAQVAEAEKLLTTALTLNAKCSGTYMCLGVAQAAQGKTELAEKNLRHAIKLDPKSHEAWTHLASVLNLSGRLPEAADAYRQCIKVKPDYGHAWAGLGATLNLQGHHFEAISHFTRALELEPGHPRARFSMAQALVSTHQLAQAIKEFDTHLIRFPNDLEARSQRLFALNYFSEISREALFEEHKAYGRAATEAARKVHPQPSPLVFRPVGADGLPPQLTVAFLSPDLRAHSVAFFLEPLLRNLDRRRFRIVLYHDHVVFDDTSRRLKGMADLWRGFVGQTDAIVEAKIRQDAPDVLFDLTGHTGFNRMELFARRLAPVQIAYLGYPNTTGIEQMDFRFTDAIADPDGSDAFHTERLVRFSPTAWCYQPPALAPEPALAPQRPITFGSFNNLSKLSRQTLLVWAALLKAVPHARLLLKGGGLKPDLLLPKLTDAGIDPARVELRDSNPSIADHLATYNQVDVALDTLPYGGTTTSCEALWMGVPLVTLVGDRHAARVGASLVTAVGHPEWAAHSESEYVRIAASLATDAPLIQKLRQTLRDDMRHSPLLDEAGQSKRFGDAILQCYRERSSSRT